jgi:hypothetical protein
MAAGIMVEVYGLLGRRNDYAGLHSAFSASNS